MRAAPLVALVFAATAVASHGRADTSGFSAGTIDVLPVSSGTNAIAGGNASIASGNGSVCFGGLNSHTQGQWATVGGGQQGSAEANWSTVAGGYDGDAQAIYSTVLGGFSNNAIDPYTVVGGRGNNARGWASVIPGGFNNNTNGDASVVAGGLNNYGGLGTSYVVVGGGYGNGGEGNYSTIAGGLNNRAGAVSFTGGGQSNTSPGDYAVAAGGVSNTSSGTGAVVGGGQLGTASGMYSSVPGGYGDTASAPYSTAQGLRAVAKFRGQVASAAGMFSVAGDAQTSVVPLMGSTPGATAGEVVDLLAGNAGPLMLDDGKGYLVILSAVASGPGATRALLQKVAVMRASGTTTIEGAGSSESFGTVSAAGWTIVAAVGTSPDRLVFRFSTGTTACKTNIVGSARIVEVASQ